jgi:sodium transport system permease protein
MLAGMVSYAYPISEQAAAAMKPFTDQISAAPLMSVIFLMAVIPAICEELAFRGFIFGGLVRNRGKLRAVLVTAIMFGISHGVLQQSICATIMGLLLGYIALKTGSVLPGILIHAANNSLSVSLERVAQSTHPLARAWVTNVEGGPEYNLVWVILSIGIAAACLMYFARLPQVDEDAKADLIGDEAEFADPTAALSPA